MPISAEAASNQRAGSAGNRNGPYTPAVHNGSPGSSPVVPRALPNSLEAEQGLLGSMLISPQDVIGESVQQISEAYFYLPAHGTIYQILVELWNGQKAIDFITLTQILRDRKLLDGVGGPAAVTHLFTFTPTAANASYYLEIVREKYILREIISACTTCAGRAYEEQGEVNVLLDDVERRVLAINENRFKEQIVPMKDLVMEAIETIETLYERRGALTGLPTGFKDLDRLTSGLHRAEMIVVAARPSMGKTALAMNIAEHVALVAKHPVAVFSLEMSNQQLVQRLLCSRARVNLQKLRDGFLSERDFPNLTQAASKLAESQMYIDDTAGLSILELRAKARRLKTLYNIELIVIDYLQLLRSTSRRAQDNRQLEIAEISAGIKGLAKELNIPIIVLAQLNRQPEARSGGKPRLSDLRESGSIEQDADLVALLVRSEVYEDDEEAKAEKAGEAELIIAKQRNGPVGEVRLTFLKEFTRFEDRAPAARQD
jgi:replicative DNA helicase